MAYFNGKPGTASGLLTSLLAVDGAGSLFDADLLDSLSSAAFARVGANTDITSLAGTATNDSAAAGKIGEFMESNIAIGSAVALSTGAAKTITSLALTAGDWDVFGQVSFIPAGTTTMSVLAAAIHTTTDALPTSPASGAYTAVQTVFTTGQTQSLPAGMRRVSIAGTTTLYLIAYAAFAVSTMTGYGYFGARRAR